MNNWRETTLGGLAAKLVNGGTPPTDAPSYWGGNIPWITGADFNEAGIGEFRRFVSSQAVAETATNVINKGELLIVTRTGVGKLAIAPCDIAISQDITGFYVDHRQTTPEFLYHRMRQGMQDLKKLNQGTSINGVVRSDLERYPVKLPPLSQQRRIAEILGTVDEAIEQAEALIAKQQQVKAGLMHDLFTRGLTPDGQLRPPYAEAPELYHETSLGWLPREWTVESLGRLAEIVSGVTLGAKTEAVSGIEVPYLRVANVQDGYLDLSEIKTIRVSSAQLDKLSLRAGDVLMNEGGDFDKLGRGTVWNEEITPCVHQNHVFRVRPRAGRLLSSYLAFWSQSTQGKKYFVLNSKQSTNLASINSTQLHRFPVALPKVNEQREIEARTLAQNNVIAAEATHLAKLRQLKQGLMQALLTPPG